MILDGIVIIFLALSAYTGYKKGLATILITLIGFIIAMILAFSFKSNVADFIIEKTDIDVGMNQMISEGLNKAAKEDAAKASETNSFYSGLVRNMGIDEGANNLSAKVVRFILETAAFILIFFIVTSCAFILQMMLNLVFDLPILSSINSIGGLGAGIIMALFKVWVILAIVSIIIPMFGGLKTIIDSSTITKVLYDTNILVRILASGLKF